MSLRGGERPGDYPARNSAVSIQKRPNAKVAVAAKFMGETMLFANLVGSQIGELSSRLESCFPSRSLRTLRADNQFGLHGYGSAFSAQKFRLQPRFRLRPFAVNDAEINGVADAAVGGDDMFAENAFLAGADAQNGLAGPFVEGIGF